MDASIWIFHSTSIQLPKLPFGFHSTSKTSILTWKKHFEKPFWKSKWKFRELNGSQTGVLEVEWQSNGSRVEASTHLPYIKADQYIQNIQYLKIYTKTHRRSATRFASRDNLKQCRPHERVRTHSLVPLRGYWQTPTYRRLNRNHL